MRSLQNQQESMHLNLRFAKISVQIDTTPMYTDGWVRVVNNVQNLRAHGVKIEKKLSTNSDQKEDKSICLTDKPLIALYMVLGCLDG